MLKVGLIGCGGISNAHGPRLAANPEVKIAAFCDIRVPAAERLRGKLLGSDAKEPIYEDYRDMLDKEDLDAVLVLTPHCFHYEHSKYALDTGRHVLLEKPMCNDVEDCLDLISRAESKNLVLMVSYQRHYGSEYKRAKKYIQEGRIGKVQLISAFLTQDWQAGCTGKWRTDPEISGGGQLNDSGSHLQDVVLWLTDTRACEVSATIENNGCAVDIFTSISARLENGAVASLVVSGGPCFWDEEITIWGNEGSIFYRNGHFTFHDLKGNSVDPGPLPEEGDPDTNFVGAIISGEPIRATGFDGLRVQELTRAAYRSAESGSIVRV